MSRRNRTLGPFTFFGFDAIHKDCHEHIKVATVGNPGLHLATMAGELPGASSVMTHYIGRRMEKLDIPSIPESIEMISDTGAGLYGCKASCDRFKLTKDDLIDQVKDIITVGEFTRWRPGVTSSSPDPSHASRIKRRCMEKGSGDTMEMVKEDGQDVVQIGGIRLPLLGTGRIYVCGITPYDTTHLVTPPPSCGPTWPLGSSG